MFTVARGKSMEGMENMENIKDHKFNHCLRPEFTQAIIGQLVSQRASINLIGAPGTGKGRLLEDIRQCNPPGVRMVCVDLKTYVMSYNGLLREIHGQLCLDGAVPVRLDGLFEAQKGKGAQCILFCLDNYDALLGNVNKDDRYNVDFFDDLNYLKNRDNVVLLCTTSHPHTTLPVYIAGESYRNSWLTLTPVSLPALTRNQTAAELQRRLNPELAKELTAAPADWERLEKSIYNRSMPYARLCFLVDKLTMQTDEEIKKPFKKRLKQWQKEFKRLHKNSWKKRLHNAKTTARAALIASGLNKLKAFFQYPIELIKAWKGK